LDADNLIGGFKPLRDAIAATLLHTDDAEKFVEWEYHQVKTAGRTGTSVRIETTP